MQIRYAMTSPPASVPPAASLEDAARHMAAAGVGALPVVDGDEVIGMVTDRDLVVRAMAYGLSSHSKVEMVMSTDPVTVDASTPLTAALHAMRSIEARHLPVVAKGRLVGMVSFDDLFWYLSRQLADLAAIVDASRKAPRPLHESTRTPSGD
ncbi:CBS domain-containing protein [Streptomyces silvisoli]|uniref:CBS domain-containing protein n=1 Tax=Streptomyces silvisoli TaxID=3034235 RepID=A0ABT5ZS02_9ACTN|nr:CBS domain-containing protein [Streptomyces silvisoli]MDF3292609.1 CBS domain-containing protein [Streptomyces silvisoli]